MYGSESRGDVPRHADTELRMVRDARSNVVRIVGAAALVASAGCYCMEPEQPPLHLPVATVEIIPSPLSVRSGSKFIVRARLKDEFGIVLPGSRAAAATWTLPTELQRVGGSGDSLVVSAKPGATPLPASTTITATVEGKSGVGSITIVTAGPVTGGTTDWIASDFSDGDAPTVALVDGVFSRADGFVQRSDSIVAFVGESPLEAFDCPGGLECGEVTVFAPGHALAHGVFRWTSNCDLVNYRSTGSIGNGCTTLPSVSGPLVGPIKVPVVVWMLSKKLGLENQVNADIEYVRDAYRKPWLGIELAIDPRPRLTYVGETDIRHGAICQTTDENDIASQLHGFDKAQLTSKRITVVYVDGINKAMGDETGFTCPFDDIQGTIILMSASGIGHSTLAHELGHALGQWTPPAPAHPDIPPPRVEGIESSNLLWSGETEWAGSSRRNLTLGQIAQMNLARFSFVKKSNLSGGEKLDCLPDPKSEVPCPRMARDFTK